MTEHCPLGTVVGEDIPETCMRTCFDLWDLATLEGDKDGSYDQFEVYDSTISVEDSNCMNSDCSSPIETSHEALEATGQYSRRYIHVDGCEVHGEVGQQAYRFTCPLPLEPDVTSGFVIATDFVDLQNEQY